MSLKRFIDDKAKNMTIKLDRHPLKLHPTKKIDKSPAHYLTNTPHQRKSKDFHAFVATKGKPFRIAKSSTKRRVFLLDKPNKEIEKSCLPLPQIHLLNNKLIDKERSNNELLFMSNINRNNQFKFSTSSSKQRIETKQHFYINNHNITPVQLFKIKKEYSSSLMKYSCLTKPGTHANGCIKTNQDSYLSKYKIFGLSNYSLFGVFDGHGLNGHLVSRFLRDFFLTYYTKVDNFNQSALSPIEMKENNIHSILTKPFLVQSSALSEDKLRKLNIDSTFSGSTGVIVIHIEDTLYCVNTGDSRAIYINGEGNSIQISRDHKPNLPDEEKRIRSRGGRVDRAPGAMLIGPFRVWLKNQDYPGLAMSRSYGDSVAKSLGVISEPEIYEISLTKERVRAVIIASDGLWEFITNEMVASIIYPYLIENDCYGANKKLMKEAHASWTRNGFLIDDITIVVLFF